MDNNGNEALTQDQFNTIAKMAENTRKNPNFAELDGIIEGTCWWTDQETELPLKCRPDILTNKGIMVDLKSTSDARSWAFSKSIHEYMYHLSAAMYLDGVRANGIEANEFHLIAVENKYPYAVAWYRLDAASLDKGYELYKKALWKIKEGLMDESPAYYSDEIQDISLPSYGWTE
jgi:exodeoxyribonuclease VIII